MWTIYKKQRKNTKFKEIGDSRYIYQKYLDKACFQHDMAYGDFKDLTRRIVSDKILHDKAFNIAKNLKYDRYQRGLASMVHNENMSIKELVDESQKQIIKNFQKRKVH